MHPSRLSVFAAGLLLAAPYGSRAAAAPPPDVVPVVGRAATPNAFQPALPCTLMLIAPGDRLIGRGLRVVAEPPAIPTPNGDFAYLPFGPDDYSFDQVNVFRHAQRFLERLQRYGLDLDEFPITVRVQQGIGSFTNQSEPNTTIGTGLDGRNAETKDSDMIVHELTHAVFNPRMPLDRYPLDKGEALPVAEGLADYFAAAVNGDTHIGEYASPPDGYHDIATDSTIYNYQRWDQVPGDPYSRGKVLNGALLTLRRTIGETADELVFAALDHRPLRCMPCFADAMRWSDGERYGGAHLAAIDAAFATRGIGGGPPSQVVITGPAYLWTGDTATLRLQHHCGLGPFTTEWFTSQDGGATWQPLPGNTDSVVVTPAVPFLIEATLRDQRGGETAATPPSLMVYRSDDPTLRFHGVHVRGPATVPPGQSVSYTAALDGGNGVAPVLYQWTVQGGSVIGPSDQPSVVVMPALGTLVLSVLHTDAAGQSERDSLAVPVDLGTRAVRGVHIQGPAELEIAQTGSYGFALDGGPGFAPLHLHWASDSGRFSSAHEDVPSVAISPANGSFRLSLVYSDAAGQSVTDTIAVQMLQRLSVSIAGPDAVAPGQSSRFTAAVAGGLPPYRLQWTEFVPDATVTLPDGPEALIGTSVRTFSLVLSATDLRGVVMRDTNVVAVSATVSQDDREAVVPLVFQALGSVVRRGGPITFEIPGDLAGGSLDVLDLAGRVVLTQRLARTGGTTATVALPGSLAAGIYFARLVRPAHTRVARFVVVPP